MASIARHGTRIGQHLNSLAMARLRTPKLWLLLLAPFALAACVTPAPVKPATQTAAATPLPQNAFFAFPRDCNGPTTQILDSVVRVASTDGSDASGVVIAYDRVLTAAHVVNDSYRALVYIGGNYRQARVLALDHVNDLAMLAVQTDSLRPIRISSEHLFQEEPVWTVGFPLALEQTANRGIYQQHVDGAIHASAATNAGASGGGLLRCAGGAFELAGMIRGYGAYRRGDQLYRIEDLSISVPAETISDFALSAGIGL